MAPSIIATLEQRPRGKGKIKFELYDDGKIVVHFKRGSEQHETPIDLSRLEPHPQRHSKRQRGLLILFIVLALGLFGSLVGIVFSDWENGSRVGFILAAGVLAVLSWFTWKDFISKRYDVLLFVDPITGRDLAIHHGLPDQETFADFVAKLEKEIAKYSRIANRAAKDSIADQIRELAKLKDEGILTEEEFQTGKRRILEGQSPAGPIGFPS